MGRPWEIELLEVIADHGSISAAARAMNMSYKRAWDLVEEISGISGRDVIDRQTGGKHGGGTELVKRYRRIESAATKVARDDLIALQANTTQRKP
ncbi:winged helix-turn-helix domain-containing protein (plasmid) [Nitrobacteraceae bacterium UC4446_H13]